MLLRRGHDDNAATARAPSAPEPVSPFAKAPARGHRSTLEGEIDAFEPYFLRSRAHYAEWLETVG